MKIGITGGIGSGKSTVCRLFSQRGIAVYDSDREAKRLMTEDQSLKEAIKARFGEDTYTEGELNRAMLAQRVFGDEEALAALNALVHPAVMRDFEEWTARQESPYVVLESAILFSAHLEAMVDRTLAVLAPEPLRVARATKRDGCSEELIRERIKAQMSDDEIAQKADYVLVNIMESDLAPEVERLDQIFRHETAQNH